MSGYATDHISDPRYLGTLDEPPEGFIWADKAMCCPEGTELWHNGESLFSPHFRWCHVTKKEDTSNAKYRRWSYEERRITDES